MADLMQECIEVDRIELAVADTTSETVTDVVDMQGYDELEYVVTLGDVDTAAVLTFTPKENTANSTSSPTPTAVTLTSVTDSISGVITSGALVLTESSGNLDNKTVRIGLKGSVLSKRYQFLSITVATESYEIVSIHALKRRARNAPITQNTDVVSVAYASN